MNLGLNIGTSYGKGAAEWMEGRTKEWEQRHGGS